MNKITESIMASAFHLQGLAEDAEVAGEFDRARLLHDEASRLRRRARAVLAL